MNICIRHGYTIEDSRIISRMLQLFRGTQLILLHMDSALYANGHVAGATSSVP